MKKNHRNIFYAVLVGGTGVLCSAFATDLSGVPGTVIHHMTLGSYGYHTTPGQFISDPEIVVLSNGDYLATHALAGRDSGSGSSGTTYVFVSHDKGANWSQLGGTLGGVLRGSLTEHNGALYLIGSTVDGSGSASPRLTVWKSTNYGTNWTSMTTSSIYGTATPWNPVVFSNRLWGVCGGRNSLFASATADLMQESSWDSEGGFPEPQPDWRSGDASFIGEGQVVASPSQVYILPVVRDHALTALAMVDPATGAVSFDPDRDFADFPGGDKKFGVSYDAVSGRFYALSNPILAVDKGVDVPNMIRNTTAMLSSPDLRNWNVEKIFQYSPNSEDQGFCYPNFDFDGTNMVVATRGAYKVGDGNDPRRSHDSNLLAFNAIAGFRSAGPNQYLKISGGDVLRYERTEDEDAPLGPFALGSSFAGSPISSPDGLGQYSNGDVYIHEAGGRILRFDAAGSFIGTTNSSPVAFQPSEIDVNQLAGCATWTKSGSGEWSDPENWYYWRRADTKEEIAVFGSAATAPATITAPAYFVEWAVKGLRFRNAQPYTLAGDNQLVIEAASGNGSIELQEGSHEIRLPVRLESDTGFSAESGTSLTISSNELAIAGQTLKMDSGRLVVGNGGFSLDGGSLAMAGGEVWLTNSASVFDGSLEFQAPENFSPAAGDSFHVLEGDLHEGMFEQVVFPTLEDGLAWDTSALYTTGDIAVILKAPEAWMAQYGLPTDGSADFVDTDGDSQDNYSEWKAGTNPTNALSFFDFDPAGTGPVPAGIQLRWNSLTDRTYRVEMSTNLLDSPAFMVLQSGIPGVQGPLDFIDAAATNREQSYYRVYVE